MEEDFSRNFGLDLVRVTEAAALNAGRWMGLGKKVEADHAATQAMFHSLNTLNIEGYIAIGEEGKLGIRTPLDSGEMVGTGDGPKMDVIVDPIDGTSLLAKGHPDSISVAAVAPRGTLWAPFPSVYMEKIVVNHEVADYLVTECLDAPAAWTLALVARAKEKAVRDLVVFVLDRPRHQNLIEEIRIAGARVLLQTEGDIAGALRAATDLSDVDILMGIGGVAEGVIAACAVKCLGGAMLGRLAPQSDIERAAIDKISLDVDKILTCDEIVKGDEVFFSATSITDSLILSGVRYQRDRARTQSIVLRYKTRTRRTIITEHLMEGEDEVKWKKAESEKEILEVQSP